VALAAGAQHAASQHPPALPQSPSQQEASLQHWPPQQAFLAGMRLRNQSRIVFMGHSLFGWRVDQQQLAASRRIPVDSAFRDFAAASKASASRQ
jgi:hypothetical protein